MIPHNCTFCGLCCTLAVRLSSRDIKRIERTGRKKEGFAVADSDGKPLLKRDKGWCIFLQREGKTGRCTIYDYRPGQCRDFPGKRLCELAENPLYRHMSSNEENKRIMQLLKEAPTAETPAKKIKEAQKNSHSVFLAVAKACSTSSFSKFK